jgi:predicted ester cyclase
MMTTGDSQVAANKAAMKRALERISAGDVDGFVEILAPNYVRHCQAMPPPLQEIHGPSAMRDWLLGNKASFPDYHEDLEEVVGEGNMVAWRSVGTGTQNGPFGPFPPSGRRLSIVIIGMHRFENGKIVETWTSWDNMTAATQLGLLPTP